MDALRVSPRFRLAPVFEWVVAALFLFATLAVGSMIVQELRPSRPAQVAVPAARPIVVSIPPAAAKTAAQPLAPPTLVPLERCLFKPRGMFPYTGATYLWDCSPGL